MIQSIDLNVIVNVWGSNDAKVRINKDILWYKNENSIKHQISTMPILEVNWA